MDLLLKANDIRVEFLQREVLNIDELELYQYDRVGLVGGNGAGKSTLLRVLTGELAFPGCRVARHGTITYMPQLDEPPAEGMVDLAVSSRLGVLDIHGDAMSGGEETRLKIAGALSGQTHAIFADEPTCHLDRAGIEFLIGQLKAFDGALLIVSHDRHLLDSVVDRIWELHDGGITEYWGGYSEYIQQKEAERRAQLEQYRQVVSERERLNRAAEEKQRQARRVTKAEKDKKRTEGSGHNSGGKTAGAKEKALQAAKKNIERRAETLEDVKPPEAIRAIRFRQSEALALHNKFPITGENVSLRYGDKVLFEGCDFAIPLHSKVALTGANGSGKTSLFKMIMEGAPGIRVSPKATIGYFDQTGYKLKSPKSVIDYMKEDCDYSVTEIRAVLASMGFTARDIEKPLDVLSGGERIKLTLSKLLTGRYNILLLDEPGNYLDLGSTEALEAMIAGYAGTVVLITHDQRLIDGVADVIYEIRQGKMVRLDSSTP